VQEVTPLLKRLHAWLHACEEAARFAARLNSPKDGGTRPNTSKRGGTLPSTVEHPLGGRGTTRTLHTVFLHVCVRLHAVASCTPEVPTFLNRFRGTPAEVRLKKRTWTAKETPKSSQDGRVLFWTVTHTSRGSGGLQGVQKPPKRSTLHKRPWLGTERLSSLADQQASLMWHTANVLSRLWWRSSGLEGP